MVSKFVKTRIIKVCPCNKKFCPFNANRIMGASNILSGTCITLKKRVKSKTATNEKIKVNVAAIGNSFFAATSLRLLL